MDRSNFHPHPVIAGIEPAISKAKSTPPPVALFTASTQLGSDARIASVAPNSRVEWNGAAPVFNGPSITIQTPTGQVMQLTDTAFAFVKAADGNTTQTIYVGVANNNSGANNIYRSTDGGAFPLAGQRPRISDVAIQAGRHDQQHHAHLVAFPAVVLAR